MDAMFRPLRSDGWKSISRDFNFEYPPFSKRITVWFLETQTFHNGMIIMSGNNVCLQDEETGRLYNLDSYITYWKIAV